MLSCGNKVSPASLVDSANGSDYNSSSGETGQVSSMESQHSQVSLFSGSENASSLELFSSQSSQQQAEAGSGYSATSYTSRSLAGGMNTVIPPQLPAHNVRGKKYYTKYLLLQPHASCPAGGKSVLSNDADSISSKMHFETWKDKQQDRLERKQIMTDVTAVIDGIAKKLSSNFDQLREEIKNSTNNSKEDVLSRWEKETVSLCNLLIQDQKESKLMIEEMRNEMSQQRNMLELLSKQLSSMTAKKDDLRQTHISVSTQTSHLSVTSDLQHVRPEANDEMRAVDARECNTGGHCSGDANMPVIEATVCPISEPSDKLSNSRCTQDSCVALKKENQPDISTCQFPLTPHNSQASVSRQQSQTRDNTEDGVKLANHGKRKNVEIPAEPKKVPCKSTSVPNKAKQNKQATAIGRRRSKRVVLKPLKYMDDSNIGCSLPLPDDCSKLNASGNKIRRKIPARKQERSCSREGSFLESPVNALSDAFYSGTSAELLSGVQIATAPSTAIAIRTEKFHRKNEAAKRRKIVISNLTDSEFLLREIQDCILNRVNSDPSP